MDLREAVGVLDASLREQEVMIERDLREGISPVQGIPRAAAEVVQSRCLCGAELARYAVHVVLRTDPATIPELKHRVIGLLDSDDGERLADEVLVSDHKRIKELQDISAAEIIAAAKGMLDDIIHTAPPDDGEIMTPEAPVFPRPEAREYAADAPGLAF